MKAQHWFREEALQLRYEAEGFVIVDFFTPDEVKAIRAFYAGAKGDASPSGFHSTLHNRDTAYRTGVREFVSEIAAPKVSALLQDFRIITCSFVVKEPGEGSAVQVHQDWSLTDEALYPAMNIWVPLTPITRHNGPLHILPGSHKLPFTWRGTGLPDPCAHCLSLPLSGFTPVYLQPGQAVVYDVRMIHASPPNHSPDTRLVTAIGVIPAAAQLLHYRYLPQLQELRTYAVTPELFIHYAPTDEFFAGQELSGTRTAAPELFTPFTAAQLQPFLRQQPPVGWLSRIRDFLKS